MLALPGRRAFGAGQRYELATRRRDLAPHVLHIALQQIDIAGAGMRSRRSITLRVTPVAGFGAHHGVDQHSAFRGRCIRSVKDAWFSEKLNCIRAGTDLWGLRQV